MTALPEWLLNPANTFEAPHWLNHYREKHLQDLLKQGLPHAKHERWKYTDLAFLIKKVFEPGTTTCTPAQTSEINDVLNQHRIVGSEVIVLINGIYNPQFSSQRLPEGVILCHLREALTKQATLVQKFWPKAIDSATHPFASLNNVSFIDGLFLYIPKESHLESLHLLFIATAPTNFIAHPHHLFVLDQSSYLNIIEEHISLSPQAYFMNMLTTIRVEENAKLEYYKIQQQNSQSTHLAYTSIQQQKDSFVNHVNLSYGSVFARDDVIIQLEGTGANCRTSGYYHLTQDHQYIDHHIDICHAAPLSCSEMLYKGILENKSKVVFNGRLHVQPRAQKTLAYQANHHLLLSKQAEAYAKPELEIYADDVQCKHGATTGELNQDTLFYLQSRGIPYAQALQILLTGFATEVFNRIALPEVTAYVQQEVMS